MVLNVKKKNNPTQIGQSSKTEHLTYILDHALYLNLNTPNVGRYSHYLGHSTISANIGKRAVFEQFYDSQ